MNGYLLDTNVVSELTNPVPHPEVMAFLAEQAEFWLASVVVHELEFGLQLLPEGRQRSRLSAMLSGILSEFDERILPLDRAGAEWAASLRARARRSGKTLDLGDALIAGIAGVNNLAVVTRNVRDFDGLDIPLVNPWNRA